MLILPNTSPKNKCLPTSGTFSRSLLPMRLADNGINMNFYVKVYAVAKHRVSDITEWTNPKRGREFAVRESIVCDLLDTVRQLE